MKYKIVNTFPNEFFDSKKAPLISLYQETSRHLTDNKRDALVFKNLIEKVESSLIEKYSKNEIKPLMDLFESIENESIFWSHTFDGIALFATLDECIIYNLRKPITTFVVVADSFHIKPLIQYFQFVKTYQILDLNGKSFQILEGDPYNLKIIDLNEDIKTTMDEILGTEKEESYHTRGTYGGAADSSVFHGHGGNKAESEIDLERFFRRVDTIVHENVSKSSQLPLILLSLVEYHTQFLELSNNFYLEPNAIAGTYETLRNDGVMKQIELYARKVFNKRVEKFIDQYHQMKSSNKSSDQLIDIVSAVVDGRIETLLIEENKIISGKIDSINKKTITEELNNPEVDDILDDLAQFTIEKGGEVFILSKEDMPTKAGVAAVFRY